MKTFKPIIILLILIFAQESYSQALFPTIEGKTLTDKKLILPKNTMGKYTLVGMAYSRKAEDQLNTWFKPVYTTFIKPEENSLLPSESFDLNIYFIPMITGIAQAAGDKIEDKLKKEVDKDLHPYVMLYEGEVKSYKEKLKMTEKDQPYFFVLDEQGKIIHTTTGAFSDKKFNEILDIVEKD